MSTEDYPEVRKGEFILVNPVTDEEIQAAQAAAMESEGGSMHPSLPYEMGYGVGGEGAGLWDDIKSSAVFSKAASFMDKHAMGIASITSALTGLLALAVGGPAELTSAQALSIGTGLYMGLRYLARFFRTKGKDDLAKKTEVDMLQMKIVVTQICNSLGIPPPDFDKLPQEPEELKKALLGIITGITPEGIANMPNVSDQRDVEVLQLKILIGQLCNAAGVPTPDFESLPNDKDALKAMLEEIIDPTYADDSNTSTSSSSEDDDDDIEPYDEEEIAAEAYAAPGLGVNDEVNYNDPMNSDIVNKLFIPDEGGVPLPPPPAAPKRRRRSRTINEGIAPATTLGSMILRSGKKTGAQKTTKKKKRGKGHGGVIDLNPICYPYYEYEKKKAAERAKQGGNLAIDNYFPKGRENQFPPGYNFKVIGGNFVSRARDIMGKGFKGGNSISPTVHSWSTIGQPYTCNCNSMLGKGILSALGKFAKNWIKAFVS